MIDFVATQAASWIRRNSPSPQTSEEVLKYALVVYLNGLLILLATVAIGWLAGTIVESLVALVAFSLLRAFSGGFHFSKSIYCFAFSVGVFTIVPHVQTPSHSIQFILLAICLILVISFAPNMSMDQIANNNWVPYMKWIAAGMVTITFFLASWVITLTIFIQCLSLIPLKRR